MPSSSTLFSKPVWPGKFPDPFLLRHELGGGGYVAYATGNVGAGGRALHAWDVAARHRQMHLALLKWDSGRPFLDPAPLA